MEPIAYLTCELKGRDLNSRALIAAQLVKRGFTVVLGQYWSLKDSARFVPQGTYLFKTSNQIQAAAMAGCKLYGHAIVASDEEVLSAAEEYAYETTVPATFDVCDLYLAVSQAHKRSLERVFPHAAGRIRVVGSSRFDLLRTIRYPEPHTEPFILINTSFGLRNTIAGDAEKAVRGYFKALQLDLDNAEHKAVMQARLDWEKASMRETGTLIRRLVERNNIDIIIRPHPNENANWWKVRFKRLNRTYVIVNSDAYPWIQHAALLIHSDSTTGLEAAIMGTPTINISPVDGWGDRCSLRSINYSVRTADEAMPAIEMFLDHNRGPIAEARHRDAFPHDCANAIAEAMAAIMPAPGTVSAFPWPATPRGEIQRQKFAVSKEEFADSLGQAFHIAECADYEIQPLYESVVRISPRQN